ncbi:MAG: MlaE family lipid ABC transporter permease subunit [Syntrophorhabdales bacterium]|jgi:phospholipid/cholesterol/gamma-HCH transport system permease protein
MRKERHQLARSPFFVRVEGEVARLSVSGRLTLVDLSAMTEEIGALFEGIGQRKLLIDLQALDYVDSAGALFILRVEEEAAKRSIPFEIVNMSPRVSSVVGIIDRRAVAPPPAEGRPRSVGLVEETGMASVAFVEDIARSITFGGSLISEVVLSILRPSSVRWKDVLLYMKKVGVDGLPILGLISYLLGLIIAFMSSLQLKQFGANMYVASLVAIAMVRELGPIMTGILVAGRSGSAFAAEIGTMKVNEEVDALVTMGFDPVRFLAIPKVFASILVVPLLTFFSDLFGILGGMTVGVLGLDLTIHTYTELTSWALEVFDVVSGVVKSMVFAILIAGIGCQRGFQASGGAEAVGNATTSAVVAGLFLIIVADSTFAIILNYVRW